MDMSLQDLRGAVRGFIGGFIMDLMSTVWVYARVYVVRFFRDIFSLIYFFVGIGRKRPDFTLRARVRPKSRPLRCDIYLPKRYINAKMDTFPAYVNLHGGGFVAGSPADDAEFCAWLAKECDCVVLSLGYRLAPEHKHPAAVEDAADVAKWLKRESPSPVLNSKRLHTASKLLLNS